MVPNTKARGMGYPINLYLDAATRTYLEEFGTSNFIGITKDGRYVTPDSPSILRSITNKTLMQLAADQGLTVEQRPVKWEEVHNFSEAAACGTAVVLTPVRKIVRNNNDKSGSITIRSRLGDDTFDEVILACHSDQDHSKQE